MIALAVLLGIAAVTETAAAPRVCAPSAPRTKPCMPAVPEVRIVATAIEDAMKAYRMFDERAAYERGARALAVETDFDSLEAWEDAVFELRKARRRAAELFDEAISKAADVYGVRATVPSRRLTEAPMEGVLLEWSPRAWLEDGPAYRIFDRDGGAHFLPGLRSDSGEESAIRSNGNILLDVDVFARAAQSKDPRDFALILTFETARYDGVANGLDPKLIQRKAIEAELAAAIALGVPQGRIDRLNKEWQSLVKEGVWQRPPPDLTDYYEHIQLSNIWQGGLEAERLRLHKSLESQRERRREQERERERLEDGRRLFASLEAFSRRFCESAVEGAVPESMHMDFLEWRNGNYLAFSTEQPMIDLGELGFSAECPKFFENQILVARRKRYNHSIVTFEWAAQVVKEAYRRSHPVIPTLPSSRPVPPRVPEPVVPDGGVPPDADIPEPPSVPPCRYHAWCREKTEPRDN